MRAPSTASLLATSFLLWALASPASAFELSLQTTNDPISGNDERADDLYTAAVAVDLHFASHRWTLGERMFTDRDRGLRFDETFLEASRELPSVRGWQPEVTAGVLHVGHGFLGEGVQNEIHRWVGSERVDLPYIRDDHWYATGRLRLGRVLAGGPRALLATRIEASATPGFQQSLRAEVFADLALGRGLALRAGVGARAARVETSLLEGRVDEVGPTWELGVSWRDVALRYSFNDQGTETQHLALVVRVGTTSEPIGESP